MYNFGAGNLFATRTDIANASPVQVGVLQDVSISFAYDLKSLMGQNQFAVDVARGAAKVEGKAKAALMNATALDTLFFGQGVTNNVSTNVQVNEAAAVPASTPFTVTVSNGASFTTDLGVINASTGRALKLVPSAPATGQYTVGAGGVYTFAAADTGMAILISYKYSGVTGNKILLSNALMGAGPSLSITLAQSYRGKVLNLELFQVMASKFTMDFKNEDFTIPEYDFMAFTNAASQLGAITITDP